MRDIKIISKKTAEKMLAYKQLQLGRKFTDPDSGFEYQVVTSPKTEESYQYLVKSKQQRHKEVNGIKNFR